MKNLLKSLALVAVSALAVVSCQKNELVSQNDGEGVFFSLRTGDAGKTYIVAGEGESAGKYLPQWAKGDEIGVLFEGFAKDKTASDGKLENTNESGATAKFEGTIAGVSEGGNLYAFYPSKIATTYSDQTVGFDIVVNQKPTATSFDPAADLLISKQMAYSVVDNKVTIDGVQFARALSMLKINVYSSDFAGIQGQYLSKLTVTSVGKNIGGRPVFNLVAGDAKATKYNKTSESVSAMYDEEIVKVTSLKTTTGNSVFLMVAPVTIGNGTTLKFEGETSGYTISKEVVLTKDMVLTPGKLTEINLSLIGDNCKKKEVVDYSGDYLIVSGKHLLTDFNTGNYYNYVEAAGEELADFWEIAGIENYVWTVAKLADGNYSFYNAVTDKYLALTVDDNKAHQADNADENTARFNIAAEESALTIYSKAYPERKLRCNTSSPRFAFYGSTSSLPVASLLAYTPDLRPKFDVVSGLVWDASGKTLSWTAAEGATNGYEYTKDNGETVTASETNSIDCSSWSNGDYSVKVRVVGTEEKKTSQWSDACAFTISGGVAAKYYTKVTEDLGDWSGTYLIVCGTSAANGTIESKWLKFITVTVDSQNGILSDSSTDAVAATIAEVESGIYNIQFANGKYLGTTTYNDGIKVADSAGNDFKWKFSVTDGNVKIESTVANGRHLRLNGTSGFRTYTSTTGTQATLYKLDEVAVTSITVSGTPTKTAYSVGEAFDTDGLVVTATYADASQKDITNSVDWTVTPETLSAGTTSVKVVATYKGVTSNEYVVNGLSVKALNSISVKTAPTKVVYTEGEKFDPAGLVIYRNYSDETKDEYAYTDHENEFTFDPDLATALATSNTSVTITYSGKSVNQAITVNEVQPLSTMDEIFAAATTAGSTATDAKVKFNNWVVSGVKGSNAYLTDNNGKGLIIYTSNHGFEVGNILNGTVDCKVQLYKGSAELTSLTKSAEGLTVTAGGTITPATISIASLSGVNTGAVITFESLTYNGSEFSDGANTIKPYNTFITLPTLTSGRSYKVTGMYLQYDTTKEIAPRTADDFVLLSGPYLNASASKTSGIAAAGETVTITVDTNVDGWTVTSDNAAFVVGTKSGNTVPVVVSENTSTTDGRTAHITVSATGVNDVVIELTQSKKSSGGTSKYVKVTSSTDLTDGTYLIICESQNVAFNGSLTTLDAVSNTVAVTISNNEIATSTAVDAAAFTFTASNGSFKGTGGKYFGNTSNSNALTSSNTALANTVSISDGNADIVSSGGAYLRYNKTSGQTRFRYYKSSTYTSQQAIQLYKLTN